MIKSVVSVVVCIILVLSLCACSNEKQLVLSEFSRTVSFTMDDITVTGELNFKNKDDMTFTIAKPENLSGIVFTESTVNIYDVTINYAKLKDESPVFILISTLKTIAEGPIYLPLEGEFTVTVAVSSAEYRIIFDCEKEEIKRIETGKFTYNFE